MVVFRGLLPMRHKMFCFLLMLAISCSLAEDCDYTFTSSHGNITSPGFPSPPPQGSFFCSYSIVAEKGKRIQLQFVEVKPNRYYTTYGCRGRLRGSLRVYEYNSTQLRKRREYYCFGSKDLHIPYLSLTNAVDLRIWYSHRPFIFKLQYKIIEGFNMDFRASEGLIASPNFFSNPFPGNETYNYRIEAVKGMKVQLFFSRLGSDVGCSSKSSLSVYDGEKDCSCKRIEKRCSWYPTPFLSSSNVVSLRYNAKWQNLTDAANKGFKIFYSVGAEGCKRTFNESSGVIYSPLYGSLYPEYVNCTYTISVPKGNHIQLEMSFDSVSFSDVLDIVEKTSEGEVVTNPSRLYPYYSSGNTVMIQFTSKNNSNRNGFFFNYTTTKGCNIDLSTQTSFISNLFPSNYPNNVVCNYFYRNISNSPLLLSFYNLDLESSPSCNADSLTLYDGIDSNGTLVERFCGSLGRRMAVFQGKNLFLQFKTDDKITAKGFEGSIFQRWPRCNKTYGATNSEIKSLNFPYSYPNRLSCTEKIVAFPGANLTLNFTHFDLEWSENCNKDSLKIYEGSISEKTLVSTRCGNDTAPFLSKTGTIFLKFTSDSAVAKTGFKIKYDGCKFVFTNQNGSFNSPSYPDRYPENILCNYLIRVHESSRVQLSFPKFNIRNTWSWEKQQDQLRIYDGADSSAPLARTMTKYRVRNFLSSSNEVYLEFQSFKKSTDDWAGFQVDYFENLGTCNRTKPCGKNGRCIDLPFGKYKCYCNRSYMKGVNCSIDTRPCGSNPCYNGGTCYNRVFGDDFFCTCESGYGGKLCEEEFGKIGSSKVHTATVVGGLVGGILIFSILIAVAILLFKRRRANATINRRAGNMEMRDTQKPFI